jgi:micrococcal nuclease
MSELIHAMTSVESYRNRLELEYERQDKEHANFSPVPDHGGLGLIIKVYDGDTLTILCEINGSMCALPVRLYGVDAPEIRGGKTEEEAEAAKNIRDLISDLFVGRFIHVKVKGRDKYGRLLASAEVEASTTSEIPTECCTIDLSEFLIKNDLVYPYNGKAKRVFEKPQLLEMIKTCRRLRF